jgi:hypothetical protein
VNQPANDEKLLTRVALLHEQAVASSDEQLDMDRVTFRRRLEELTRRKRLLAGRASIQTVEPAVHSSWVQLLGLVGAGLLVLLGVVSVQHLRRQATRAQGVPATAATLASNRQVPSIASIAVNPPRDPCETRKRAPGKEPLIDDFEDGNPLIAAFEDRVGLWSLFKDSDFAGSFNTITPTLLTRPTQKNRYALHAVGGELLNWGATISFPFQPACYDASAYAGVTFSAKGPGRVFVGMREVSVVPVEYGGACTKDCYNTHEKKVDLSTRWQSYTVLWSEMRQRGYDTKPLDPSRTSGMSFLVHAADTPYDFWLDDVKFATR